MIEPTQISDTLKRVLIAVMTLSHIQFAAFLIGIFGMGVTMEFFGLLSSGQSWFDRFARGLGRTAVIIYSTGAVLAIIFMLVFALFFPTFWYTLVMENFWPLFLEAITFALTVLYLFPWYYTWNGLARFKAVHVSLGLALVVVAELQQGMIDIVAGYMLTPTPPQDLLRVFLNPTAVPLDAHRLVGDFSFAGFVVAGFAAFRTLRSRDPDRRSYYDWMGNLGLAVGLGFLFLQPLVGIAYVEEIRANSPGAFNVMMRGRLSWIFEVLVFMYSILFFLSVYYMHRQVRKSGRGAGVLMAMLIIVFLSAVLLVQPYVIGPSQDFAWLNWANPIGTMQPWKYIAFGFMTLASIIGLLAYLNIQRIGMLWGQMERGGRGAQYVLLTLALLASATMLVMGYVRESSRYPYLIYNRIPVTQPMPYPPLPTTTPSPSSSLEPENPVALTAGQEGTAP